MTEAQCLHPAEHLREAIRQACCAFSDRLRGGPYLRAMLVGMLREARTRILAPP
jgi:hypothetical protein